MGNTQKTIRLAHVVCVLPPYGGGLGIAAHEQATLAVDLGYDTTVFAPISLGLKEIPHTYTLRQLHPILKIGHGSILLSLLWRLWRMDIVELHFPFFGSSLLVALVKLLRGKKQKLVIYYHQDLILNGFRSKYHRLAMLFFAPWLLKLCDKIIVSSEDYAENSEIQEFYQQNLRKFTEIPFSVPPEFKPGKKNLLLLTKYHFKSTDHIVLFVGGLDSAHYFKGVNYLIKAFSLIKETTVKCLIIGKGNLLSQYQNQVKQLKLTDRIKFAGYVSNEDLPDHYRLANYFILPSINKNEAFGIVLIEAMATGLPLIASNLKGVRQVVGSCVGGLLVEPQNPQDIADKINLYLNTPQMATQFSNNNLKRAQTIYNRSTISAKLDQLYKSLLKND